MDAIRGKIIIITGASSGIGEATARELARRGAVLVLAARRQADLDRLVAEITAVGGTARAVVTDVTVLADLERLVATTVEEFGRIDVVFNNAGVDAPIPIATLSEAQLMQVVATNLLAPIRLSRAALPHMPRGGHIITTGSVAGHIATPGIYAATKFGVRGFSDATRRELRHRGIHVSLVAPGFIRTPMTKGVLVPMPGPESVARAVVRLLQRPRREVVVPWVYRLGILLHNLMPGVVDVAINIFDPLRQRAKH